MGDYFKGWRRKLGCVTLLMACAVMGVWARSLLVRDQASFFLRGSLWQIASDSQTLRLGCQTWRDPDVTDSTWPKFVISDIPSNRSSDEFWAIVDVKWRVSAMGFDFGRGVEFDNDVRRWVVPFWAITIPFAMLSAYLLLWNPRKVKPSDPPTNPKMNSN